MTVENAFRRAADDAGFVRGYLDYLGEVLGQLDAAAIAAMGVRLDEASRTGANVWVIGNGGSAATATHMQNDLGSGIRTPGQPDLKIVSLTDNNAVITAVANDLGYEHIFTEQLAPHLREGDTIIAFSVSGNSPNIVRALDLAEARGAFVIGITGFDGGELRRRCQLSIHVPTEKGEYGPAEDAFMIVDHILYAWFLMKRRGTLARIPA